MGQGWCCSCLDDNAGEDKESAAADQRQSTRRKTISASGEVKQDASNQRRQPTVRSTQRSSLAKKAPSGKQKKKKTEKKKKKLKTPIVAAAAASSAKQKKKPMVQQQSSAISAKPSKAKSKATASSTSSSTTTSTSAAISSKAVKPTAQPSADCFRQTKNNIKSRMSKSKKKPKQKQQQKSRSGRKSKVTSSKSSSTSAAKSKVVEYRSKPTSQVILKSNYSGKSGGSKAHHHQKLSTASSASSSGQPLHVQSVNELFTAGNPGSLSSVISLGSPSSREGGNAEMKVVEGEGGGEGETLAPPPVEPPQPVTFREDVPVESLEVLLSSSSAENQLLSDQSLATTANGMKVNRSVVTRVRRICATMGRSRADIRTVLYPPYCSVDQIVPGLFLCGFAGTTKERLQSAKISLLLNVTWELGLLRVTGLRSFRVPVDDSPEETIGRPNRRAGGRSLVHCLAGVSRSATLVLAYLLKYTTLSLHQAFVHLHSIRPCVRPNIGFFRQLIEWELRLRGGIASTQLVTLYRSAKVAKGGADDSSEEPESGGHVRVVADAAAPELAHLVRLNDNHLPLLIAC
ncbi:Dual specificity protein phosphatase 14 [Tyrophagus putrescentiae]|nr:Dual specificity protein phosphatase 14 [Tyrophagus putrescentiae]